MFQCSNDIIIDYDIYIFSSIVEGKMETGQLRHIQNIENSLTLLKFKIEKLGQIESQKGEAIDRLILSTIPVVDKKLREDEERQYLEGKKSRFGDRVSVLKKKNMESRIINEKEVTRSKELMTMMKQHNSMHLKKSKKQNEEKIKKIKELNLVDKKQKKLRVREQEQEAQRRIQQFHEQKTKDLKYKREIQNKENQHKIQQLMQELTMLSRKEQEMQQRVRCSDEHVTKFRSVIRKVDKMKCQDFNRFKEEISPEKIDNKKLNSRCLSEAILLHTAAQKS